MSHAPIGRCDFCYHSLDDHELVVNAQGQTVGFCNGTTGGEPCDCDEIPAHLRSNVPPWQGDE